MVVFTCAHCGDSIQKPKVEKHYDTKCRNKYPDVCCVDCLKDFRGDEYKTHLKCISEAERYGKKGFVAKENKGEKKQCAWIEIVQSVLEENTNLSKPLRIMLEKVSKQPNTPRKESKFFNFIKSMDPRTNPRDIESAWKLLSVKLELIKGNPNRQNDSKDGKENSDNNLIDGSKKDNTTIDIESESPLKNEQRKSKKPKKMDENTDMNINLEFESQPVLENDQKKSKKRKIDNSEANISDSINGDKLNGINGDKLNGTNGDKLNDNNENLNDKLLTKKERKEKKKRDKYEAELNQVQADINDTPIAENEEKKSKKRKLKDKEAEVSVEVNGKVEEPNVDQSEPLTKKAKKDDAETFDWTGAISSVLNSKKKEISMKKLQKKVLTEFCATTNSTVITDRINKKFMKSLKKIENVVIDNDKISIMSVGE